MKFGQKMLANSSGMFSSNIPTYSTAIPGLVLTFKHFRQGLRRPRVNHVGYPPYIVQRRRNRAASGFGENDYHGYLYRLNEESATKYGCDFPADSAQP